MWATGIISGFFLPSWCLFYACFPYLLAEIVFFRQNQHLKFSLFVFFVKSDDLENNSGLVEKRPCARKPTV